MSLLSELGPMPDAEAVMSIVREVAQQEIVARFRQLSKGDIREKKPGDLVTVADEAAEVELTRRLTALLPGSFAVGEESVAQGRIGIDRLAGPGVAWVVDPLDGTSNFARGDEVWGTIIALVANGRVVAGWMYEPLTGRSAMAELGGGTWVDGVRASVGPGRGADVPLDGLISVRVMPEDERPAARTAFTALGPVHRIPCAVRSYVDLAIGKADYLYSQMLMPWDHAAGLLFHTEAGGYNALSTGQPYSPAITDCTVLATRTQDDWHRIIAVGGGFAKH
jgi:fructose-1,6-bisphosphatase/inositol monophosphatase family enzyme